MKPWLCANCQRYVELDRHGRCEECGSDAVDIKFRAALRPPTVKTPTVAELERLYQE